MKPFRRNMPKGTSKNLRFRTLFTTFAAFAAFLIFATASISCDENANGSASITIQKSDISSAASKVASAYPKASATSEG